MSKVIASEVKDLSYFIDYFVEKTEYEDFKNRVIDQVLKNVEVKGFRKGHAPREKAMKEVNPMYLQQTILNETLDKYGAEAVEAGKKALQEMERVGMNFTLDENPETMKEDENGFQFRLTAKLLPEIDIDAITSVKIDEPSEKDLTDRPSFDDFQAAEKTRFVQRYNQFSETDSASKNGSRVTVNMTGKVEEKEDPRLTANDFAFTIGAKEVLPEFEAGVTGVKVGDTNSFELVFPADYFAEDLRGKKAEFSIEVVKVEEAKFSTVEEILAENEEAKKQFESPEKFDTFLQEFFAKETKSQLEQMRQRRIITSIVENSPEVELNETTIESEVDRVTKALAEQAQSTKISIGEAYLQNNLPVKNADKIKQMDELQIKAEVAKYVRSEFKLSQILSYVYEVKVEKKPSTKEFDDTLAQVKANPDQFNIPPNSTEEQMKSVVMDRIVRQLAANWLFEQFAMAET